MKEPIRIYMNPEILIEPDNVDVDKIDMFYRRLVEYISNKLNGVPETECVVILIDDDDSEFEMKLPYDGYGKSLDKSMGYFLSIEDYEMCSLIKKLKEQLL